MTLNIELPVSNPELKPKITVVGVGGAGGNAVNNMIQSKLGGVDFLVTNTDAQALQQTLCERQIQLGRNITQGLGAGSRPDIGRAAAEEALDEILVDLEGAHMVFVTAGMGGGTGTGAAPVIARAAREAGILTVGVITKPFHFEGVHRMRLAEEGINELSQYVDTLIIIPNQNLFRVANEKTTFADAFKMADDVLESGVRGVTDLMVNPGLINLDFADIRSVMSEMGKAMMGTGEAEGENRAVAAAEAAISNPLLDDVSMRGARGVLINITGGQDLTLFEVDEAANRIRDEVDPEANIIFGSTFDDSMEKLVRVSVVATGIDADEMVSPRPVSLSVVAGGRPSNRSVGEPESAPGITTAQSRARGEAPLYGSSGGGAQAHALQADLDSEMIQPAPAMEPPRFEAAPEPAPQPEPVAMVAPQDQLPVAQEGVAQDELEPDQGEPHRGQSDRSEPEMPTLDLKSEPAFDPFLRAPENQAPQTQAPQTQAPEAGVAPTAAESQSFYAPPPPVRAASDDLRISQGYARAEPLAEADLMNASRSPAAPSHKTRESLFARVTNGAARALQAATSGIEESDEQAASAAPDSPPRVASGAPDATAAKVTEQPGPGSHDPKERTRSAEFEEDLLDIPAFLRRQAN